MFLARVLTGLTTKAKSSYRRPPHNPKTKRLFDSVEGLMNGDPTNETFVIFDPMQHYPEYLIEFGFESKSPAKKKQKAQVAKKSTATPQAATHNAPPTPAPPAAAPTATPAVNPFLQVNAFIQMPPAPAQFLASLPVQGLGMPGLVTPAPPAVVQAFTHGSASPRKKKKKSKKHSRKSSSP